MKVIRYCILFSFLCMLFVNTEVASTNLESKMTELEVALRTIATNLETKFLDSQRCADCFPSYFSCGDKIPDLLCSEKYNPTACTNCENIPEGMLINSYNSGVTLANKYFPYTDWSDKSVKEAICFSKPLEADWRDLAQKYPFIKFQYFGSYNGIFRVYPFYVDCTKYDARTRPWYNLAASGRRNIIILLDISKNMEGEKINIAKSTIYHLLERLNTGDYISIIAFNDKIKTYSGKFLDANGHEIESIKGWIEDLEVSGGVNYETAFRNAYQYFYNFSSKNCQNIMMFLSYGGPATAGIVDPATLLTTIQNLDVFKTSIFSYGIGFDSFTSIPRQISCAKNGIYKTINSENDIENALSSFFKIQYNSLRRTQIVWTEPYEDHTIGTVTTVAVPIYDRSNNNTSLAGVMAIDISLTEMNGGDENIDKSILDKFVLKTSECNTNNFNTCQLEDLRAENKCLSLTNNLSCEPYSNTVTTCNSFDFNPFFVGTKQAEPYSHTCCAEGECILKTQNTIYTGAILGGLVGLAIIALIIFFIIRCCCKKGDKQEEPVEVLPTEKRNINVEVNLDSEKVKNERTKKPSEVELINKNDREENLDKHQLAIPQGDDNRI